MRGQNGERDGDKKRRYNDDTQHSHTHNKSAAEATLHRMCVMSGLRRVIVLSASTSMSRRALVALIGVHSPPVGRDRVGAAGRRPRRPASPEVAPRAINARARGDPAISLPTSAARPGAPAFTGVALLERATTRVVHLTREVGMLLVMTVVAGAEARTPTSAGRASAASATAGVARLVEILDGRVEEVGHLLTRLPEELDEVLGDRGVLQIEKGGGEAQIADTPCDGSKKACAINSRAQVQ